MLYSSNVFNSCKVKVPSSCLGEFFFWVYIIFRHPSPPNQAGPSHQVAGFQSWQFAVQARRLPLAKLPPPHITSKTGGSDGLWFIPLPPFPFLFSFLLSSFDFFHVSFSLYVFHVRVCWFQNKVMLIPGIVGLLIGSLFQIHSKPKHHRYGTFPPPFGHQHGGSGRRKVCRGGWSVPAAG